MPSERPIAPRIVLISLSDFLPKFFVLSSSASVFGTRSARAWMFAALKQLDARTESSSSSTLRKRFSFRSVRGGGSSRLAAAPLRCRLGEVRNQFEVVLKDPRRLGDRRGRRDAAIGPHLKDQPLPAVHGRLDVEVHALDRREVGIEQDRVDGQRLGLAVLGGPGAAA